MIEKRNQANHHEDVSEKSDTSRRRASGRSFRKCSRRGHCVMGGDSSVHGITPEDLPVRQEVCGGEDSEVPDPDLCRPRPAVVS